MPLNIPSVSSSWTSMKRYSKLQPLRGNFPPIGWDFEIWHNRSMSVDFPELTSPGGSHIQKHIIHTGTYRELLLPPGGRLKPLPKTRSVFVTWGLLLALEAATSFRITDLKKIGYEYGWCDVNCTNALSFILRKTHHKSSSWSSVFWVSGSMPRVAILRWNSLYACVQYSEEAPAPNADFAPPSFNSYVES